MQDLTAEYFFQLMKYEHASLFVSGEPVWKALERLEAYLKTLNLGKIEIDIPKNVFLVDAHLISIGSGSIVEPGAYIKGPCVLGKNCTVRHGAYIRGNLVAGDGCVIGHDTEIKHSILLDKAHAAHFAYVGDSILGNNVNLGAGTKCANLKFDSQKISVRVDGRLVDTGLRKFGAIIGDNAQTGCNSVTNPGTLLGQGVLCYPGVNVGGFVPSKSIVKNATGVVIKTP